MCPLGDLELEGLDRALAAVAYDDITRSVIADLKYRGRRASLGWAADALAATVGWAGERPTVVTWIPASIDGTRRRGFDQGRRLATGVADRLNVPLRQVFERSGRGRQTERVRADRLGARPFVLRVPAVGTVLLVDDVITTGSSMASAAALLRSTGARRVVGVALAHKV